MGVIGGTVAGALHHKNLGLSDADKARITVDLNAGKAAVAVMAHDETAPAISDRLAQLGGSSESHELTDEALEAAGRPPRRPDRQGPRGRVRGRCGGSSTEESVVLAVFENRNSAERMLRALGREFRQKAHAGDAAALVISGNADGSLKLTQSRVVTASGVGAAVVGVSVAMMAGLLGTMSALKGAKSVTGAATTCVARRRFGAGAGDPRAGGPASSDRTPSL